MRNLNLLFIAFLFCFCTSCSDSKVNDTETPKQETLASPPELATPQPPAQDLPISTYIRVKYISATVYASATDYKFIADDGQEITIRVSGEEGAINPTIPDNMLEPGEDLEGPPGANPEMVGRFMSIEQDPSGKYLRVIYSRGKSK